MTKMDYAAQFTATREKKLKSKRARQKIARHLQANLEALESWVAKHCGEQELANISNHLSELTCKLEYQLNKLEVY